MPFSAQLREFSSSLLWAKCRHSAEGHASRKFSVADSQVTKSRIEVQVELQGVIEVCGRHGVIWFSEWLGRTL